jgi:hypothetical protein
MEAVNDISEVSVSVHFVSEDHITPSPTVAVSEVVAERNVSAF